MRPNFKPSQFITFLKELVAGVDETAVEQFGQSTTVYIGHAGGATGSQNDTPFCVLIPNGETLSQFTDTYSWSYTIAFCSDGATMDRDLDQEVTMLSVDRLTELVDAFVNDLNDSILDRNITLASLESRWSFDEHPLTSCILEATFTMPNTLGISTVDF